MAYALISNDDVVKYPYSVSSFRADNPNTSLPAQPTESQLNEVGMYTVYASFQPAYDPITQNCTQGTPVKRDGKWYETWVVTNAPPAEVAARQEAARAANKQMASDLLYKTDWTTIPDVSNPAMSNPHLVNVKEFVDYRNILRQIAVNPPITVSGWPEEPQAQWS